MLLSKSDINLYYKFSENIPDAQINPFINDAEIFDMQSILPTGMYTALLAQVPRPQIAWDRTTSYTVGNIIFHIDRFYKCLIVNSNSEPTLINTNWGEAELLNLWLNYIKPFYAYNAIYRFLLEHGANITQFGFVVTKETDVTQEVSDKRRAEIRNSTLSKCNHYLGMFNNKMKVAANTFDGVLYTFDNCTDKRAKPRFGLFQQGCSDRKRPLNNQYPYNDQYPYNNEYYSY